jgi:putative redox protein
VLGFCEARAIATDGIELVQSSRIVDGKLVTVDLEVRLPADFPEKYVGAVRRAAETCKVKRVLNDPPPVNVSVIVMPEPTLEISA